MSKSTASEIRTARLSKTAAIESAIFPPHLGRTHHLVLMRVEANRSHEEMYVTWDAAAWHNSASLLDALDHFNEVTLHSSDGPVLELVPLPTSAQFLNVVEGALSGMTRAVVDNSDYPSAVEMKHAISRHLVERNEHYQNNPKRAGKKIWELDFFHDVETLRAGDYREW